MEGVRAAVHRRRLILFWAAALAAAFLLRHVLRALGMQLLAASLLMLLALPLCRQLEKRLPGSAAAILALAMLMAGAAAAVLLLVNLMNNVFRFPLLKHLDWLLGGVFGLVRGAVIVMLIFSVVPTVCSALESMNIPLLTDIINQSKLAVIVQENNMISGVISTLVK